MQKMSPAALGREHLARAREAGSGRSSQTGGHEHTLRQTLMAPRAGTALSEHQNPGEAAAQVIRGRCGRVPAASPGRAGDADLIVVPDERHDLQAVEDSVVLLTVAKHRYQQLSGRAAADAAVDGATGRPPR